MPMQKFNVIVLCLSLSLLAGKSHAEPESLKQQWQQSRAEHYKIPSRREIQQAEQLFKRHFLGEWNESLKQAWLDLGFEVNESNRDDQHYIVIKETTDQRHGRGFYVFNPNQKHRTALKILTQAHWALNFSSWATMLRQHGTLFHVTEPISPTSQTVTLMLSVEPLAIM